jgi:hypothetical protein
MVFTLCTSRATSISGYLDILNGHFPVGLRLPPVLPLWWWTCTPSTCSDLNFNPDELQQLEAIQGIELMLFNLFFLVVLVILVSKDAHFPFPYSLRTA